MRLKRDYRPQEEGDEAEEGDRFLNLPLCLGDDGLGDQPFLLARLLGESPSCGDSRS